MELREGIFRDMNPLHQIPNEIASMIKGYARTEYVPFTMCVFSTESEEKEYYKFESCVECEFITMRGSFVDEDSTEDYQPIRIRREHFLKTIKYIVQDRLEYEGATYWMTCNIFKKFIVKDGSKSDEDILREVMEFAEEYFEVAIAAS